MGFLFPRCRQSSTTITSPVMLLPMVKTSSLIASTTLQVLLLLQAPSSMATSLSFKIPDMCSPQGNPPGKGHALACDGEQIESWEQKYFKHSYAMKSLAKASVVV